MKNRFILLLCITLFFSCKKDELEGDHLLLEGKWKWKNSLVTYNTGTPDSYYEIVPSDSFGIPDSYFLEFDRKGKVKFYKNDVVEKKYRIVFNEFEESTTILNLFNFEIYLNNDSDNTLQGFISNNNLQVYESNIPLENQGTYGSAVFYRHRYIKVN